MLQNMLHSTRYNEIMLTSYRIYGKGQNSYFLKHSFSALGVTFSNILSINEIANINYITKIEKAQSLVQIWRKRDLTLLGKETIIKSLVLSQIVYIIAPLSRPSVSLVRNLNSVISHFLWGCKRDKIKREVVTRSRQESGSHRQII